MKALREKFNVVALIRSPPDVYDATVKISTSDKEYEVDNIRSMPEDGPDDRVIAHFNSGSWFEDDDSW